MLQPLHFRLPLLLHAHQHRGCPPTAPLPALVPKAVVPKAVFLMGVLTAIKVSPYCSSTRG